MNPRPMAVSVLRGIRIAGISSAVPCHVRTVLEDASGPLGAEAEKISQSTGVRQRHVSQKGACASDLCLLAAERLLGELSWPKDSVELLVFVSQTPDYVLPATSCCLQSRLGLPKSCAAFDINLGCSGFVYGLWVAAQLARSLRGGASLAAGRRYNHANCFPAGPVGRDVIRGRWECNRHRVRPGRF